MFIQYICQPIQRMAGLLSLFVIAFSSSHQIWPFQFSLLALTHSWNFLQQNSRAIFQRKLLQVAIWTSCCWHNIAEQRSCSFAVVSSVFSFSTLCNLMASPWWYGFPSSFFFWMLLYFLSFELSLVGHPLLFSQYALSASEAHGQPLC